MICEYCGSELLDGATTCGFCGATLKPAANAGREATGSQAPAGPYSSAYQRPAAAPGQQAASGQQSATAVPSQQAMMLDQQPASTVPSQQAAPGQQPAAPSQQAAPAYQQAAAAQSAASSQPAASPQPVAAPTASAKRSRLPLIVGAVAAIAVIAVLVGVFALGGKSDTKKINVPSNAVSAIQDSSALAQELSSRYASYRKDEKSGSSSQGAQSSSSSQSGSATQSSQSSSQVRTYDMASDEINGALSRVQSNMAALEASGTNWDGYEQARAAMKNLEETLVYERDILEAQHNASVNGNTTAAKLEAVQKLFEGYSAIKPPEALKHYVKNSVDTMPAMFSALVYSSEAPSSTLSQYSANELMAWWLAKQSAYDSEGTRIMISQCDASRDMLDSLASGVSKTAAPAVEVDAIEKIAPNLYPSLDSVVNLSVIANDAHSIAVEVEVAGFTQKFEQKFDLAQGYNYLPVKPAVLPQASLPNLNSNMTTQLNVKVTDSATGAVLAQKSQSVEVLSMYDFTWYSDEFGSTAAFDVLAWLRPQADEVSSINRAAADVLGKWTNGKQQTIAGYQYGTDVLATLMQVAAIQKAISDSGVVYIMDPYSFTSDQHILTPDVVVQKQQGLCIETSLLMASCLMSANMHPLIIVTPGHAQIAVETYNGSGNYFLIETTTLPYGGVDTSYEQTNPAFYNGLLASAKTDTGGRHYWTTSGSSDEWKQYLQFKSDGSDEFGGVFVIDCNLQRVMGIQGLESIQESGK